MPGLHAGPLVGASLAMISPDELQPFLDLLKSRGMSDEDAADAARYVLNVKHVRMLLSFPPDHSSDGYETCSGCYCAVGLGGDAHQHRDDCVVFESWQALDHSLGHGAVGAAWDRGARLSPWAPQRRQVDDGRSPLITSPDTRPAPRTPSAPR